MSLTTNHLIFEDKNYILEQSSSHPIPGYLILTSKSGATSLSTMPSDALINLGPLLSLTYECIESVLKPERIYLARFGEVVPAIHFHLFPRTKELGDEYRKIHSVEESAHISGPQLLDWVMAKRKSVCDPALLEKTLTALREKFNHSKIKFKMGV